MQDLGPIPEYSFEYILESVFPPLSANIKLPTLKQLTCAGIIVKEGEEYRWSLLDVNLAKANEHEDNYFKKLAALAKSITKLVNHSSNERQPQTAMFVASPNTTPISSRTHAKHQPDFYFSLINRWSICELSPGETLWEDIVCCGKVKMRSSNTDASDVRFYFVLFKSFLIHAPSEYAENCLELLWYHADGLYALFYIWNHNRQSESEVLSI